MNASGHRSLLQGHQSTARNLTRNFMKHWLCLILILTLAASSSAASEHRGQVRTGELPIPGAIVRATQRDKVLRAITDTDGRYSFPEMTDGAWTIDVLMLG